MRDIEVAPLPLSHLESHLDEVAAEFALPVLARLPLDSKVAQLSDAGRIEDLDVSAMMAAADLIEQL